MKVQVRSNEIVEVCDTDDIDMILGYLDFLFVECQFTLNLIINDYEYVIDELKDYFPVRNQLLKERSSKRESRELSKSCRPNNE